MLSVLRRARPAATKLRAREVGPRRAISSNWAELLDALAGESFLLVVQGAGAGAGIDAFGDAAGQGADAGVGEESVLLGDGKLVVPEFWIGVEFGQGHVFKGFSARNGGRHDQSLGSD
jgi:hypothetical protein